MVGVLRPFGNRKRNSLSPSVVHPSSSTFVVYRDISRPSYIIRTRQRTTTTNILKYQIVFRVFSLPVRQDLRVMRLNNIKTRESVKARTTDSQRRQRCFFLIDTNFVVKWNKHIPHLNVIFLYSYLNQHVNYCRNCRITIKQLSMKHVLYGIQTIRLLSEHSVR